MEFVTTWELPCVAEQAREAHGTLLVSAVDPTRGAVLDLVLALVSGHGGSAAPPFHRRCLVFSWAVLRHVERGPPRPQESLSRHGTFRVCFLRRVF